MAETIASFAVAIMTAAFGVAAASKIASWEETIEWIAQLGLPQPSLFGSVAVAFELLFMPIALFDRQLSVGLALIFLAAATGILVRARALRLGCACFGSTMSPVTAWHLIRNLLLAVIATAALAGTNSAASNLPTLLAFSAILVPGVLIGGRYLQAGPTTQ